MKKGILAILAATLLSPIAANADVIVDTVEQHAFVNWGGHHKYTHNINDHDFVLGSAIGGTLQVLLHDTQWSWGKAALFIVEDFDFDTGGLTFGSAFVGDLEVNALGELNEDGKLDVRVKSLWGRFWVGNSTLTVQTRVDVPSQVPEPGTLLLLGAGMLGIGLSRRRRLF